MFNGQSYAADLGQQQQQQPQQQQHSDGSLQHGQVPGQPFMGGIAANPQFQALLQQQQMQQMRWQQMQQHSGQHQPQQPPSQQQQLLNNQPSSAPQQQQFFNPAAFLSNNSALMQQAGPSSMPMQNPMPNNAAGNFGNFAVPPNQQHMQQQGQRQPLSDPAAGIGLGSINPQQLQAMLHNSGQDATLNPASMLGANPGGNQMMPGHSGGMIDPSVLMQQIAMQNMGHNGPGMPFPGNVAMANGSNQQYPQHPSQRPPTASSQGDDASDANKGGKGGKSGNKKAKGGVTKSEAAVSTPTIGHTPTPSQSPGGATLDHVRQQSFSNAGRGQPFPGPGGFPSGVPPHLQTPAQPQPGPSSWSPSLSITQQQEIMSKAWEYAKGHNMPPADVLGKMNLLFVKAEQLPGGGAGVSMPNGGAIITFDEGKMLGLVPPGSSGLSSAGIGQQSGMGSTPQPAMPAGQQMNFPSQSSGGMPFASHAQGPPNMLPHQSPAPQHLQQQQHSSLPQQQLPFQPPPQQHPSSQSRARTSSVASRPDSRSGFPGNMGPPAMVGQMMRRPSVAMDLDSQRAAAPPGASSPVGMTPDHLRRTSAQQTQHHSGPQGFPGSGPPVAAGSLPPNMIAGPQTAMSANPRPPPPDPNLPPVHGGALPPTTAKGNKVTKLNTRVTPLPNFSRPSLTEEDLNGASWEPMTAKDEEELLRIMAKDAEYEDLLRQHNAKMHAALRSSVEQLHPLRRRRSDGSIRRPDDLHWWERAEDENQVQVGHEGQFRIIFPDDRREELKVKRGGRVATTSMYLERLKPKQLAAIGDKKEDLVPVRLEIDHEGWKLRDTFTWNSADDITSYDEFARGLCEDYGLPEAGFVPLIRESLAVQIGEHLQTRALKPDGFEADSALSSIDAVSGSDRGRLKEDEVKWWQRWRGLVQDMEEAAWGRKPMVTANRLRSLLEEGDSKETSSLQRSVSSLLPVSELRIAIKLDITVGAMNLIDTIEWDILDESSSPEGFAHAFAVDLGLAGEFETAIAHSVREQIDVHIRSLALAGYAFDGSLVTDDELKFAFLPEIHSAALATRVGQEVEEHTPKLLQLTEAEVDRLERERERENKRKRRQTRGRRGVNMPDRDPLKTQRTPIICGLQAYQIEAAGGAAAVAAAAAAAAGGPSGLGDFAPGVRSSTRRAAAAANAHLHTIANDYDTPTPAAERRPSEAPVSNVKRQRLESHAVHFKYPGGLGRATSEGPLFAPTAGQTLEGSKNGLLSVSSDAIGASLTDAAAPSHRPTASPLRDTKASTSNSSSSTPKGVRPEDIANQHPNMHDGQWHCSNCGIPGTLTAGRRKGPLGEKTLCGFCGKFWHRFRRMKQVDYTRDEAYHRAQLTSSSNGSGIPAPLGHLTVEEEVSSSMPTPRTASPAREDTTADEGPGRERKQPSTRGGSPDLPFQPVGSPSDSESDRSQSPRVSRRGSPAKQRIVLKKSQSPSKVDGVGYRQRSASPHQRGSATLAPPESSSASVQPEGTVSAASTGAGASSPPVGAATTSPPAWLSQAADALRQKYPEDHFELRAKGPGLWRIKCIDCPGKLYTPGPAESLTNFEVHLKNRAHRAAVAARLERSGKSSEVVAAAAKGAGSPLI